MTDTDMTGLVGFPLTYDADAEGPAYTAASYRMTAGAAHAVPDGSPFGGIQGVRAGSPSPLVSMDGTTATVKPHMGWLCPWPGGGCYTYAVPSPVQVPVDSTTGSYKIAVVLEDRAAGHGSGERVGVQVFSGTTDDRMIDGLVIATVNAGEASDQAPVISQETTIRVDTKAHLQKIDAVEGTQAILPDGTGYVRRPGEWKQMRASGSFQPNGLYGEIRWWRDGNDVTVDVDAYWTQTWVDPVGSTRVLARAGQLPPAVTDQYAPQVIASGGVWGRIISSQVTSSGELKITPRTMELRMISDPNLGTDHLRFQQTYQAA